LDPEQRYPNYLQIFLYFAISSFNQEDYIVIDAKCLVFLGFSPQTLVFILRIFETLYQPFTKVCSRKATLLNSNFFFMSSSFPSSFLDIHFGVCNSFGLAPRFPDGEALSQTSVSFNSSFFKS